MHGTPCHSSAPSKEDYRVSMKKPFAFAHSRSSEKNSWCGGGCWRNKAWWGKLSQIFLATQWLARIMHSATVSWTSRGCLGMRSWMFFLSSSCTRTSTPSSSRAPQRSLFARTWRAMSASFAIAHTNSSSLACRLRSSKSLNSGISSTMLKFPSSSSWAAS